MAYILYSDPLLSELNLQVSDSTRATQLITVAATMMDRYTKRYLQYGSYDYEYPIYIDGTIHLPAYPIDFIKRVLVQRVSTLTFACTATQFSYSTTSTGLNLWSQTGGVQTNTSLSYATYPTLTSLATAVNAVSGWTATVNGPYGGYLSSDLTNGQVGGTASNQMGLSIWNDIGLSYKANVRTGDMIVNLGNLWLATGSAYGYSGDASDSLPIGWQFTGAQSSNSFFNDLFRRARVIWSGGYQSTDSEYPVLQRICAEITIALWQGGLRLEKSQSIGYERLEIADKNLSRIPATTKAMLDGFRNYIL